MKWAPCASPPNTNRGANRTFDSIIEAVRKRLDQIRYIGAEVKFEQKEIGNPGYGCDLAPIDFVAFAEGLRCSRPDDVRPAIEAGFRSPSPALVEAVVNANEKSAKPDDALTRDALRRKVL
jgi:hypothetical protein